MEPGRQEGLEPPREQIIYANLLIMGVWVGISILLVTFGLYVTGVLTPHVPVERIPLVWGQAIEPYVEATHWPCGWSWVTMLHKGDILNYVGFVFLALLTVLGYSVLLRAYLRDGDRLYSSICILEILVLLVAASGMLVSSGH